MLYVSPSLLCTPDATWPPAARVLGAPLPAGLAVGARSTFTLPWATQGIQKVVVVSLGAAVSMGLLQCPQRFVQSLEGFVGANAGWGVLVQDVAGGALAAAAGESTCALIAVIAPCSHADLIADLWGAGVQPLMLHHGGVGTSCACLGLGVSQVILPLGFDQHARGALLQHAGVGSVLPGASVGQVMSTCASEEAQCPEMAALARAAGGAAVKKALQQALTCAPAIEAARATFAHEAAALPHELSGALADLRTVFLAWSEARKAHPFPTVSRKPFIALTLHWCDGQVVGGSCADVQLAWGQRASPSSHYTRHHMCLPCLEDGCTVLCDPTIELF